jgi:hypothetical protein
MINDATCPNSVSWGNLFVTVFAAPHLDRKPEAQSLQSSINLLHRKANAKPGTPCGANTAPYRLATVIRSLPTIRTIKRLAAPLTQTPSTAEPLGVMVDAFCDYDFKNDPMIFPDCVIMTIYSRSMPTSYFTDL